VNAFLKAQSLLEVIKMNVRYLTYSAILTIGLAGGWAMTAMSFQFAADTDQSQAAKATAASEATERPLETLDWLVGSWVAEAGSNRIEFDCRFTKNNAFMVRSFRVHENEDVKTSGMQIVGWDPQRNSIRSWTFDSDGGFADASWTQIDNTWVVRSSATVPDGQLGTAILKITPGEDGRFVMAGTNRIVGGVMEDDFEISVVKQPPSAGK